MTRSAHPGIQLRAVREAQGLSQAELSRRSGVDRGFLSRVENGKQRPSVNLLVAVARELGLKNLVAAGQEIDRFLGTDV